MRLDNYINLANRKYRLMAEISRLEMLRSSYSPSILNSGIGSIHGSGTSAPTENEAINRLMFFENINREIEDKTAELYDVTEELLSMDKFIQSIEDEQIREWTRLRYCQGESWANIAVKWFYAPTSWIVIKKKVTEYINQHEFI